MTNATPTGSLAELWRTQRRLPMHYAEAEVAAAAVHTLKLALR